MKKILILYILFILNYSYGTPIKKLVVDLKVTYYIVGRIKNHEINTGIPFKVKITNLNPHLIDQFIEVHIMSEEKFKLSYSLKNKQKEKSGAFGNEIKNKDMQISIAKDSVLNNASVEALKRITYGFIVKGE